MYNFLFEAPSFRDKLKMKTKKVQSKPFVNNIPPTPPIPVQPSNVFGIKKIEKNIKKMKRDGNKRTKKEFNATQKALDNLKAGIENPHDHPLKGRLQGTRSFHGDKSKEGQQINPNNRTSNVTQYETDEDGNIIIKKSGSHEEVYGDKNTNKRGISGQNAAKFGSSSFKAKNKKEIKESRKFYYYPVNEREKYYYTIEESEQINKNLKLKRINFLIEQLYIKK